MANALKPIVLHRGHGRNVDMESYLHNHGWTIVAYVDDEAHDRPVGVDEPALIDYAAWRERFREIPCAVTAIDCAVRRDLAERLAADGGCLADLSPSGGAISPQARFGPGTFVDEGVAFVGTLTTVGRCTIVMTPTSIGHDIVIGDFVTIYPSAAISGHVVIEDGVSIGIGAVILNGRADRPLRIGRGARVLTSAIVTTSVSPGASVSGNPARPLPDPKPTEYSTGVRRASGLPGHTKSGVSRSVARQVSSEITGTPPIVNPLSPRPSSM